MFGNDPGSFGQTGGLRAGLRPLPAGYAYQDFWGSDLTAVSASPTIKFGQGLKSGFLKHVELGYQGFLDDPRLLEGIDRDQVKAMWSGKP